MRGVYQLTAQLSAITSGRTLAYITAPANKVVEILSASVTAADTTNQALEVGISRVGTLGTPTATANTPTPTEPGDQAAGSTAKHNVTASEPTYTAGADYGRENVPSVGGWRYQPTPEERLIIPGGASIGLRLHTTSPTSTNLDVNIVFREIG